MVGLLEQLLALCLRGRLRLGKRGCQRGVLRAREQAASGATCQPQARARAQVAGAALQAALGR